MMFPSQDNEPYIDTRDNATNDIESLAVGNIDIPTNFFGELTAQIVGDVIVTGTGPNAGEKGHFKRTLTVDVKRSGPGAIEILSDAPVVTRTRTSDNAAGFVFAFSQGDQPGTIKLTVTGVQDRKSSFDVRLALSGSNVSV